MYWGVSGRLKCHRSLCARLSPLTMGGSLLPAMGCWVTAPRHLAFATVQYTTSGEFRPSEHGPSWCVFSLLLKRSLLQTPELTSIVWFWNFFFYMLHVEPVTTAWLHFQRYVKRRAVTSCVCSCSFCYGQITGVVLFVVLWAGNKFILICGRVELSGEEVAWSSWDCRFYL